MPDADRRRYSSAGLLEDQTVVEIGEGVAVAFCGKLLADHGATVIKIENPAGTEPVRSARPYPPTEGEDAPVLHLFLNRGKRSVAVNPATESDLELLDRIVAKANIVVAGCCADASDFRHPARIQERHPAALVVALSWLGLDGPWRDFACNDFLAQHLSGMAFATAVRVEHTETHPPIAVPGFLAEMVGGLTAATAAMVGLTGKELHGTAGLIDVAIAEALCSFLRIETSYTSYGNAVMSRKKQARPQLATIGQQPTRDGYVDFMIRKEAAWRSVMELLGNPEWAEYDVFADMRGRSHNWDVLEPLVQAELAKFTVAEVHTRGQEMGIPVSPVNTVAQAAAADQFKSRNFFIEVESPGDGALKLPGPPFRFPGQQSRSLWPAHALGQDNAAVLRELSDDAVNSGATEARQMVASRVLPLAGIKVADFSWIVAAPYATQLLARMGAEVIKIEGLNPLEHTREVGPYVNDDRGLNKSGLFNVLNGAKASVTLQLDDERQAKLARETALQSDIVIESFSTGSMEGFGLGFESLAKERPDVIMVSCSGFGRTGPMNDHRAFMNTIAAYIGLSSMCGYEGEPPRPPGGTFADFVAGTTIVFAAVLAYRRRRLTGKGAHIDLSMAEGTMALMGEAFTRYFLTGYVPTTRGNDLAAAAPWGSYRCAGDDKWIAIAISTDDQWRRLVDAIGGPDWTARFGGVEARRSGAAELDRLITDWTHVQDNLELAELLQARGVPAVPSSDPEDILRNPHFAARLLREQPSSPVRDNLIQNLPWHFTAFPELDGRIPAAPLLGQDNAAIFSGLQSSSPPLLAEIEEALRLRLEQDATKEAARLQSNQ